MQCEPTSNPLEKPREERLNLILFDLQYVFHCDCKGGKGSGEARRVWVWQEWDCCLYWHCQRVPSGEREEQRERVLSASGVVLLHFRFVFLSGCAWRGVALPVFEHLALGYNYVVNTSSSSPSPSPSSSSLCSQWQWQQQTACVLARKRFGLQFDLI